MIILNDLRVESAHGSPRAQVPGTSWVTIGNFDGVHLGHQALLLRARELAAAQNADNHTPDGLGAQSAIITFHPHPAAVLRPGADAIKHLTTPHERLALAAALGVDLGLIQPFTRELAALDARQFVTLLCENLHMAGLVVGPDFALGRNRAGDIPALRALGEELGFVVEVVEAVEWRGQTVRSSIVREHLMAGAVETAAGMLGRPYSIEGVVTLGDQRGRTIGIPTANLVADALRVLPANGVYATNVQIPDSDLLPQQAAFHSVTNIGVRPTVDGVRHTVEAHLLDFPPEGMSDDLYGQNLRLEFIARLRDEQRFAGLDALVAQIQRDIAAARALFQAVAQ